MCQEIPDTGMGVFATGPAFWVAYIYTTTDAQVSEPVL
jgi:hypothetical protein